MTTYLVFMADQTLEIDADMMRVDNNYDFARIDGQVQTLCFYEGRNPTRDHVVAEFVYKNISGYCEKSQITGNPRNVLRG
jgi:hypothetical protein